MNCPECHSEHICKNGFRHGKQNHEKGLEIARQKFDASGLTQEKLAEEIDIQSRDTISKFFNQKSISRTNFVVICKVLQISLEEVMQTESSVATGKAGQAKSKQKKIQTVAEDICPYVWLEAFTQDTAQFFKGRDVFV